MLTLFWWYRSPWFLFYGFVFFCCCCFSFYRNNAKKYHVVLEHDLHTEGGTFLICCEIGISSPTWRNWWLINNDNIFLRLSSSSSSLSSPSWTSPSLSILTTIPLEEFSYLLGIMFSVKMVKYGSLSGRDCSWKNPKACPVKRNIFINSLRGMNRTP